MKRWILALGLAAVAAAQVPSYRQLKFPPLKPVQPPEPVEVTLSNGMRVFLLENHELPVLRGFALVRTGNLFDPADKRGVSQVMAEVLRTGGTKSKTGDELDEELEAIAGAVESAMDETFATVSFSGLSETGDRVLEVFRDVLTAPEFRQEKIDLALHQFRGAIARRNDDPSAIPRRELLNILYGRDNPYGWTVEYEHLNRIRRQDVIDFYTRYYFPKNILLAVYGDFRAAEMRAKLEQLFGGWRVEQAPVGPFPPVTARPAPGIYLAPRTEVTQTFFAIGHLGGTFRDADYPALEVAASILGDGFKSRLMTQIRTKLGYAYSIGGVWAAAYNHPGTFRISGSTKSASTVETIQAVRAEVEKMRTLEVSEQELSEAKQAVLNSFVFFFDSPEKSLNRLMQYIYHGYPKDFLFQYQRAIENVTRADVLRVARQYWRPEQFTIVAVGNPAEMSRPLSELGPVTELDLTIPEPRQELSAADDASRARGQALLERAREAMGGAGRLAELRDITVTGELRPPPEAGPFAIRMVTRTLLPDRIRIEQDLPFGRMTIASDGNSGWLHLQGQTRELTADILAQVRGELFRQLPGLMLAAGRAVNAVGENAVEISQGNQVVRVEFDGATGLPARLTYQEGGMEIVETLSDWRDVAGVKLPFRRALGASGFTATEYRLNSGLTEAELEQRP
jgi:zinc protease